MLKHVGVIGDLDLAGVLGDDVVVSALTDEGGPAAAVVVDGAKAVEAGDAVLAAARNQEVLFGLLADALDCREGVLAGSCVRVCEHAARFADALGLSPEEKSVLERGAMLRDIGKVLVPNEILLKASVLDYDDWILLQSHTKLGAELLMERGFCADVADVVGKHHECWDGTGYPDGLERDEIPYLARAMRILDVYCAMTSPRHYRKEHSTHEQAVDHLQEERGKHFDADLVDVFLEHEVGRPWVEAE